MPDSGLREQDRAPAPAPAPARAAALPGAAPAPPPGGAATALRVRVRERVQETPEAVSLLDAELSYSPGQFLTVRIPGGAASCYSLASSPHTGEPMRITVKRVPGGSAPAGSARRWPPGTRCAAPGRRSARSTASGTSRWARTSSREPTRPAPTGARATVEVELDGTVHTVPWSGGAPLLDALLAAGPSAPYSCREGACSACCCRLVEGEAELERNEVLDRADLTEGYILACQARRLGDDRVRITYEG
ncbi:flavin reductase family protein [Streptomyces sp. NPDC097617]|uniref:flavin reductase family protein n=1 Tax=Streptomyces sp. NPDC097617 TaxID=3366091 RepID=UPI0038263531